MTIDSRPSMAAALAPAACTNLCAATPPGWEQRSAAVTHCEDKLREAMKLIEQAASLTREAESAIVPYMGLIKHRAGCMLMQSALDSVLFEHRTALNVMINYDRPVAVGQSAPDPNHI